MRVPLTHHQSGGLRTGGLEHLVITRPDGSQAADIDFRTFLDTPNRNAFVFDHNLDRHGQDGCRAALDSYVVPFMAANDYMHRINATARASWFPQPSLFVQSAGARCGIHIDAHHTQFVQVLHTGAKVFAIYPFTDADILRYLYPESALDPTFDLAADALDSNDVSSAAFPAANAWPDPFAAEPAVHALRFPLFERAHPMRIEVEIHAGDLLYVPAGLPHYVTTLEDSIATSINYVDATNWGEVRDRLLAQAKLKQSRASWESLVAHIDAIHDGGAPSPHAADVPFAVWKAGREDDYWTDAPIRHGRRSGSRAPQGALASSERDEL